MPHDEEKAEKLQKAHQDAINAQRLAVEEFRSIIDFHDDPRSLATSLPSEDDRWTDLRKALFALYDANEAHTAASNEYLAALSQK